MKTIVITGSARGFGYAMLELFYQNNYNVVMCDVNEEELKRAKESLEKNNSKGKLLIYKADVTKEEQIKKMIEDILTKTGKIDIWINNAGVNQPMTPIWELETKVIDRLIDIDLKGTILCSKLILPIMIKQKKGAIYNVEGYGSNDATMLGLSIYGTAKRAITYFTEALNEEVKQTKNKICIGKITPGIMITNFIDTSLGDGEKIELDEKTKNIYNILGDRPETIAKFMVNKIIKNEIDQKTGVKFAWLTSRRTLGRFIKALFGVKNNYFK